MDEILELKVKIPPRIVAAAINVDGVILSVPQPGRHHDIINTIGRYGIVNVDRYEQGFLLSDGKFIMRKAAAMLAGKNGQLKKALIAPPNLYTEDLW